MSAKYVVCLSELERSELLVLLKKGRVASYKRLHAEILLKADVGEGGPGWSDGQMSEAFAVSVRTVQRVRKRLVEQGLEAALNREKHPRVRPRKLDGEAEAHVIALTCSDPPEGYGRWTLRLLAGQVVELGMVESVSPTTIGKVLKKTS